jgi:hypothetical protein
MKTRAYEIAKDQIRDMAYLQIEWIVGLIGTVCGAYGEPLTQETLDDIKQAITDVFDGGVEHEWEDYGSWQWWENVCPEWFELVPSKPYTGHLSCLNENHYAPNIKCSKMPSDFKETQCSPSTT